MSSFILERKSVTLKKERNKSKLLQMSVLRIIFVPRNEELKEIWKKYVDY